MKTLVDIIRREPVWVNPAHRIESAIWLMRGHDVSALPVLDGSKLVGMLLSKHLLGVEANRLVRDVMDVRVVAVPPALSLREAADLMTRESLGRLPVINADGTLLGVVTDADLLAELRRSIDPLTELPWSDSLREWAIEKLTLGREITLLFMDVDDFGLFNKKYGHVVGDAVLRNVANIMRDHVNSELDILCRYGGDEFCIATLRPAHDAAELGQVIQQEVSDLEVMEAEGEMVRLSVGQRGGMRTREREHTHYAATLDNLINLASQDCLRNKRRRNADEMTVEAHPPETEAGTAEQEPANAPGGGEPPISTSVGDNLKMDTLRLMDVQVSVHGDTGNVRVVLEGESRPSESLSHGGLVFDAKGDVVAMAQGASGTERATQFEVTLSRRINSTELARLVADATLYNGPGNSDTKRDANTLDH